MINQLVIQFWNPQIETWDNISPASLACRRRPCLRTQQTHFPIDTLKVSVQSIEHTHSEEINIPPDCTGLNMSTREYLINSLYFHISSNVYPNSTAQNISSTAKTYENHMNKSDLVWWLNLRKPQITHKSKKCTKFLKSREWAQIKKCTVFNHGAVFNLKDKKTFRCCRLGLGASGYEPKPLKQWYPFEELRKPWDQGGPTTNRSRTGSSCYLSIETKWPGFP